MQCKWRSSDSYLEQPPSILAAIGWEADSWRTPSACEIQLSPLVRKKSHKGAGTNLGMTYRKEISWIRNP